MTSQRSYMPKKKKLLKRFWDQPLPPQSWWTDGQLGSRKSPLPAKKVVVHNNVSRKMLHFPQGEYRGDSLFPPQIKNPISHHRTVLPLSPWSVTVTYNCGTLWIIPPRIPANETGRTDTKGTKLNNLLFSLLGISTPSASPSDLLCNWEWRASKYIINGQQLVHKNSRKGHLRTDQRPSYIINQDSEST